MGMGKDKFENEELIKYGLPTDIWFHVDNFSSAHVYLRLPENITIDNIPENILEDCCQIVKHNSIQGKKEAKINIVYTPWENLLKQQSMAVGQVGFKKQKQVKKITINMKNILILLLCVINMMKIKEKRILFLRKNKNYK